ncbi:MAG: poly(R)-hydroxyalkanoic acid synthase subunit PhaE [Pseudomonadota bacterium]
MAASDDIFKLWSNSAKAFTEVGQDMADAWVKAVQPQKTPMEEGLEAWSDFVKAWAPGWDPSTAALGMRDAAATQNVFFQAFDPNTWMSDAPDQMRQIIAQFSNLPQFADLKFPGLDQTDMMQDMLAYQKAAKGFGDIMQQAWLRAYRDFTQQTGEIDWSSADMDDLTKQWLKIADGELLRTQASEGFLEAQKAMIQASTQLKQRQTEMANTWAKEVGLPTQEDLDDLAQIVTELRRDMRILRADVETNTAKPKADKKKAKKDKS